MRQFCWWLRENESKSYENQYIFHTNWWRPHAWHCHMQTSTLFWTDPQALAATAYRQALAAEEEAAQEAVGMPKTPQRPRGWEKMHQLWVGKEMGRLFFGCEFRKTPISQVIFWETFRIFECWSGFAIGQQKQGPRDYSRFQGGSKSYVATLLSVTWYLLVVGYSELVRTSIARFMRKQLTEVITNFKTSNL